MSVMEIDSNLNVTPLWGFGLAPFTTHSFTGPTAMLGHQGGIAALCDDSVVYGQTLLIGKRSGEVAVVDPRVYTDRSNGIRTVSHLGRAPHTTVCTQVMDATELCGGVPCAIARGVNGMIALFDLRRSAKHATPCLTYCDPIDPSYFTCDLNAGMFAMCNVQRGNQVRPAIVFSGGFHRLVAFDVVSGCSLLDVDCDGCVYAARLHISTGDLDVRPRWGGSCNLCMEGPLTGVICATARRVTRHDFSRSRHLSRRIHTQGERETG